MLLINASAIVLDGFSTTRSSQCGSSWSSKSTRFVALATNSFKIPGAITVPAYQPQTRLSGSSRIRSLTWIEKSRSTRSPERAKTQFPGQLAWRCPLLLPVKVATHELQRDDRGVRRQTEHACHMELHALAQRSWPGL